VAVALLAGLWAMVGCATITAAKSFDQRVAYGLASITAARTTAENLLERKRITPRQAQDMQDLADQARSGVNLARATAGKDIGKAEDQLRLALAVLTELEKKLQEAQ
jgi:hypothetical protein